MSSGFVFPGSTLWRHLGRGFGLRSGRWGAAASHPPAPDHDPPRPPASSPAGIKDKAFERTALLANKATGAVGAVGSAAVPLGKNAAVGEFEGGAEGWGPALPVVGDGDCWPGRRALPRGCTQPSSPFYPYTLLPSPLPLPCQRRTTPRPPPRCRRGACRWTRPRGAGRCGTTGLRRSRRCGLCCLLFIAWFYFLCCLQRLGGGGQGGGCGEEEGALPLASPSVATL